MTRSAYLQGFQIAFKKRSQKASRENEKKRVRGTSPRRLRGLTVMAPRHFYNPAILRGRGWFPVQLQSCDIALCLGGKLHCCYCRKYQRQVEGAFLHDDYVTCQGAITNTMLGYQNENENKTEFNGHTSKNTIKPEQKQIFMKLILLFIFFIKHQILHSGQFLTLKAITCLLWLLVLTST